MQGGLCFPLSEAQVRGNRGLNKKEGEVRVPQGCLSHLLYGDPCRASRFLRWKRGGREKKETNSKVSNWTTLKWTL